jgi:AcrR family transcriptional regulator
MQRIRLSGETKSPPDHTAAPTLCATRPPEAGGSLATSNPDHGFAAARGGSRTGPPSVAVTPPSRRAGGRDAIVSAALECFYQRGYHGTSIRDIARAAGMSAPSLYHHFASKQDILRTVMQSALQDELATTRDALLRAAPTAAGQLDALVRAWVTFHTTHQKKARVAAAELASLGAVESQVVVALWKEQEQLFRSVVLRGVETGEFATAHAHGAARAIIEMGVAVATWYRDDRESMSAAAIAEMYADLALATVQASGRGFVRASTPRNERAV